MSRCDNEFYKKLKVSFVLHTVTVDEIAAIKEFLDEYRREHRSKGVKS